MKKQLLTIAVLSVSMGLAACSSGKTTDPTEATTVTEATTEGETEAVSATVETTTVAESTEAFDLQYVEGLITKIDGTKITVKDEFEDTDIVFDIADADVTNTFPLSEGDYVEVAYPENAEGDVINAEAMEVIESVLAESEEPMLTGTVQEADDNTLTIEGEDGNSYTFDTANAYVVAADGVKAGKEVRVNYLGDAEFDDTLIATKVVTEDSYDDPKAQLSAFVGEIDSVEEHGLVLISSTGDYYTFVSPNLDFSPYAAGDTVQVTYTGSLAGKEISATDVEKK